MKLAVLSDIHANYRALEAVGADIDAWQPDCVVVAGDIVNRGPRPVDCLRYAEARARDDGWLLVRGNHEDYVIRHASPDAPREGPLAEMFRASFWTYSKLRGDIGPLQAMPYGVEFGAAPDAPVDADPERRMLRLPALAPGSGLVRIAHASMLHNRDCIFPDTPDVELAEKLGAPAPALFCVGHTHMQVLRGLNGTLVINAGAVGMPFDGDPRAGYARCEFRGGAWVGELVRLDYDRARAECDFADTGYLVEGGPLARLQVIELREARSQLFQWAARYEKLVLEGVLSMDASVDEFLRLAR